MRTKSKYREIKSDIPQVEEITEPNIPEIKLNGEKAEPVIAASIEAEPAVAQAIKEQVSDDAALALKRQIEAHRQSEEALRAAAIAAQRPMSREDKVALWRQQGLSDKEVDFLRENPEMIDFPQVSGFAANKALAAGIERDTPEYWSAVKTNFEEAMKQLQAQAAAAANPVTQQPTPKFFQPPPPPPPRTSPSIVSAPVSREAPGSRERYETENPNQMRLTIEEQEIARASGISLTEYARNKIRLRREKAAGLRD